MLSLTQVRTTIVDPEHCPTAAGAEKGETRLMTREKTYQGVELHAITRPGDRR
jgi:hypothetical protein